MYFNNIRSGNLKAKLDGELKENQAIVDKDIVIIGGGCAGVECASKLISYGIKNIVILEGISNSI
jgi:heterodisulfide reductase subunit A-like polyferredoxin